MLNPKQRAALRKIAQKMDPIFQVGKNGISDNLIKQVNDALEARELIKINILTTVSDEKNEISAELSEATNSEVVHLIGNKLTLYRRSENNPTIELP